ncbi:MAG: 2'-5' RNA ligase family protein [Promethearchaeota archaeon]
MYYVLVHYPKIDTTEIENFRKRYDFTYDVIKAHITIVFPSNERKKKISNHIKGVLGRWEPFKITLEDFVKSPDHWLFLTITKGKKTVIRLYKDLYTGILAPYSRIDLFIPHISLGYFARREDYTEFKNYGDVISYKGELIFYEKDYLKALEEARSLNIIHPTTVEELTLVELNKTFTEAKDIETIQL